MEERSQLYLTRYLHSLPKYIADKYTNFMADYLGGNKRSANMIAELIVRGEKQATCSLAYGYALEGEKIPEVGNLHVVTTWDGIPICIIETTHVSQCKYNEVTAEFAYAEGEGDKTLEHWQKEHWEFFKSNCNELGIEMNENILLVLEHFEVVYKEKNN